MEKDILRRLPLPSETTSRYHITIDLGHISILIPRNTLQKLKIQYIHICNTTTELTEPTNCYLQPHRRLQCWKYQQGRYHMYAYKNNLKKSCCIPRLYLSKGPKLLTVKEGINIITSLMQHQSYLNLISKLNFSLTE